MERTHLARVALCLLCALQGIATVVIDFNRTHATNSRWPGHARFHLVWQAFTVVALSMLELGLIWSGQRAGFYLASVLAALSPLGFLMAFAARSLYGGTLSDPNGIVPARLRLFGQVRSFDGNLLAVLAALLAVACIDAIYAV